MIKAWVRSVFSWCRKNTHTCTHRLAHIHIFTEHLKEKNKKGCSARPERKAREYRLSIPWDSSDLVLFFPELKGLGADFTFGFIQVMDGEKDPRNLLVAFRIVHDLISKDYSLGMFL